MHPALQEAVDEVDQVIATGKERGNILAEIDRAFPRLHAYRQFAIMRACSRSGAVLL